MTNHSQKNETERKRIGFFEEDNGNISSIRLMSFIALIAAIIFGFLTILLKDVNATNGILYYIWIFACCFCAKSFTKVRGNKGEIIF